jgi:hypothetical protein
VALPFLGILVLLLLSLPEVSFCQLLRKSHVLRKSHASTHEPTDTRATLGLSAPVALLKNFGWNPCASVSVGSSVLALLLLSSCT